MRDSLLILLALPGAVRCDRNFFYLQPAPLGSLRNPANCERTFIMLKPDAVHRGLVGAIMDRFESRGFKLVACKFMMAGQELLTTHYADLSKKGFFGELIRYMSSGPVVPMVWEGLHAVKQGRVMLGATNPKDSDPGTIRGDFCVDVGRNVIHGSDSLESAEKEIALWFQPEELSCWRTMQVEWVYEEEELENAVEKAAPKPSHTVGYWQIEPNSIFRFEDFVEAVCLALGMLSW